MARIKWERNGDEVTGKATYGPEGAQRSHEAYYFIEEGFGYVAVNRNSPRERTIWPPKNQALSTFKKWARKEIANER